MKPTTEQILSALNKLIRENKTELKTEKVELGLIDDIKKDLVEAADKPVGKAMNLLGQAIKLVKQAESNTKAVGKNIDKAEKQAKELGVDIPELKEYIALYKKNLNFFKQTIAEIQKAKVY